MTLLEKLKARIGKAEAEYAAARKGSQARLRASKELEAALKDTIHQNELLLVWPGTVTPQGARAAARARRRAEAYGQELAQRLEEVLEERKEEKKSTRGKK